MSVSSSSAEGASALARGASAPAQLVRPWGADKRGARFPPSLPCGSMSVATMWQRTTPSSLSLSPLKLGLLDPAGKAPGSARSGTKES